MDSKITKKRLSNFFAYDWILMIVVAVVAVIIMELIFTVLGVRLTEGQNFKLYFDETVYTLDNGFYESFHYGEDDSVFSYDVLEFETETLTSDYNVLSVRLSVQEGDAIITDCYITDDDKENGNTWNNRANEIIDNYSIYTYDKLLSDCKEYLGRFLKSDVISKDNLDSDKISSYFLTRMEDDNRFRSDEQKAQGIAQEIERIEKLCDEYLYLQKAYEYGKTQGWFYEYTKYTYFANTASSDEDKQTYTDLIKDSAFYGLKVGTLSGNDKAVDAGEYFNVSATNNADDIVLLLFDFYSYQPDLQFESVSFVNQVIKSCTGYFTIDEIPSI